MSGTRRVVADRQDAVVMRAQRMRRGDRIIDGLIAVLGALLVIAVATVPLLPRQQAILAIVTAIVFLIANRFRGHGVTMFLVMLSLAVSLRYIFWRITETLDFGSTVELFLGIGLALAEVYAIIVLVLGYIQTVWPLERRPLPLPEDVALWPTVDVFIPTYNEPMSVVRATVLGAMAMDWPREKMRVYLLDDGKREEFRQFAEACGCGYITRADNLHAKAGNLNHALRITNGEYVAVFDCDHIPTRAFLQMTMGWVVANPRIALVQTPHHFYSPDPYQRNLAAGTRVPAEGNMFYGLVQDGNDYWNAAFFCGSCGVLKRSALAEIGGFATDTVTEDAHTALRLHRRGWESAYLKLPLAAGLATERLAIHIGQRIRWARGMIQILRNDNPLFGRGLTVGQRICYFQAMAHFLFAVPRVVFLTAPLAYLLLNQNIIAASPLAIIAYAVPHIFHSVATNSRIQRNWRHSFWSEIYETVLAMFLVRVTVVTLLAPKRGKFNVTTKGGLLENGYFDLRAVYPNLFLALFLIAGIIRGLVSLIFFHTEILVFQALLLNTIWAVFSLLTVMAALSVGRETRQVRIRARVNAAVPVVIYLPDGRVMTGTTHDLSQGGGGIIAERPEGVPAGAELQIEFTLGAEPLLIPARVLRWEGDTMQVRFVASSIADEARIVQAVFGRADAWSDWSDYKVDHPLRSLWEVLVSIKGLFRPRDRLPPSPPRGTSTRPPGTRPPGTRTPPTVGRRRARPLAGSAAVLLCLLLPTLAPTQARAQARAPQSSGEMTVRPIPQPVVPLNPPPPPSFTPAPATGRPAPAPAPPRPAPANAPVAAIPPGTAPTGATTAAGMTGGGTGGSTAGGGTVGGGTPSTRVLSLTLRQLGATGPLQLRGTSELQGVQFGIRADEVVTAARLDLTGAMSPALIPEFSNDTVTLNEQYVGTIPVVKDQPNFSLSMPVSPVFFQDNNRLNFRFTGRYTKDCNDPLSGLLWSTIYDTSTLTMTLERLPPQRDLARLPLPFFDPHEKLELSLPFVLPASPDSNTLKAAGIVASWFGQQADFRGAVFPVLNDAPPQGNAVMVVVGGQGGASSSASTVALPPINGPTLAVVANPNDPMASLLIIGGRSADEAVVAAMTLAVGSRGLGGDVAAVQLPEIPARQAYDAPAWIPTNRVVRFGELVDSSELQSYGYTGLLHVPFRTAPDFFTWRNSAFPEVVRYRSPTGPIIDVAPSRLDVGINGVYLDSFPLSPIERRESWVSRSLDFGAAQPEARTNIPAYDVFGQNDLQFFFDARPLHRGDCVAVPQDLRMSIDPDSTIDLSRGYRFAQLPNLAYFVGSGFPYTRMADLSQTAVVLPDQPSPIEISAFLDMMGRFGAITGYPAIRVAVVRADGVNAVAGRDLLMMGTMQHLAGAADLLSNSPLRMNGNRLTIDLRTPLASVRRVFGDQTEAERQRAATVLSAPLSETTSALIGSESPVRHGRTLIAVLAAQPQALDGVVATFRDSARSPLIQGDLSLLSGDQVTSYRVGSTYTVGNLAFWVWPSWMLRNQPVGIVLVMVVGCILLGLALYWAMRRRATVRVLERTRD
ncbi:MAG: UDP-forming cellulose synthase catalytic subunit [Acidisphaera sp.]|nr:UDP-forming cellulose synthase catalytic subunit [Acidisphaera sp.]